MVCKAVKKGLLGAAVLAGTSFLVFGTSAPSYFRTAVHKARHAAKDAVPIQFEIDRARQEIADLEPAILNNREELARAEVDVEQLEREVATVKANLAKEKATMVALRERVSDVKLAGSGRNGYTAEEIKAELASRIDHYRNVNKILENKESTLKARRQAVVAARQKLTEMAHQKKALATKVETIQARLQAIEATQDKNEFNFDDSALARAKQTVSDLEKRLEVKARVAEMEGHFSGPGLPSVEPGRDVIKEFDEEFGADVKDVKAKTGDKSL
jgi:chromosome segregation ATPase